MPEEWRQQSPLEEKLFNTSSPDSQMARMEEVNRQVEKTKQNLNDRSVEIVRKMTETVALSHQVRRKAEAVEDEISEL